MPNPSFFPTQPTAAQQESNETFKKFFDYDIESLQIPEPPADTDDQLYLCLIKFLNSIIKLLLAGALTAVLPLKSFIVMIQALITLRQTFTWEVIKKKAKQLWSITERLKWPKSGEVSSASDPKKNLAEKLKRGVIEATKAVYNTAAEEASKNLNRVKDSFALQMALPSCLIKGLSLDKPIPALPKWGSGDSNYQQKAATKEKGKVEAMITNLYGMVKKGQAQLNTITKVIPMVDKVQNLMDAKVKMK